MKITQVLQVLAAASVVASQDNNNNNNNNNNNGGDSTATGNTGGSSSQSSSSSSSSGKQYSSEFGVLEFDNFGFEGYYKHVKKLDDSDSCQCELASNDQRTIFSGANAPINEEVSVHFRGPLVLSQFGFYTSDDFQTGSSSGSGWTRQGYYDGESQTSENITFLTAAGDNSTCLGKALTYADTDGISKADSSQILAKDTKIISDEEFIIFSSEECGKSGFGKDCGVYRDDIPAYHGFNGTTKLFLFAFEMPEEESSDEDSFDYYNMPAIWLLNAHIPRTSQYPTNGNCSCWGSGCGEFDIFEVMNTTEANHLFSTIHDYQGSDNIQTGIQAQGYISRDTSSTMKGGVVFDSQGKVSVFLSNSTSLDETISASDINDWISSESSSDKSYTSTLSTVTNTGSGKTSAASGSIPFMLDVRYILAGFVAVGASVFF
ncbi:putative secreted protein [Wickerhamomyces ciferrii]|uniref:glucan endo-1,3-beta-D-glucosidase n=1 Tax=Wickerhamomyces ciferrii (strain ATCC 14091 / BCRC 22168 / CBS 111 / JCM 3599 / NBRC 0793 / NRRL Y-1031 F-60-10) TaxID=1206466 RepID=K0KM65_WICCF|nr:uncharacterized protein BN7_2019 [Wickerhamomyces ciferrii]CCH42474.1 putative secreted protein [Wickerhamomyces ciferrii]